MISADTPKSPSAPRQPRDDTTFAAACRVLWPGHHAAGLAAYAGRPKATARSWIGGHRRPPVSVIRAVESALKSKASQASSLAAVMGSEAAKREREPPRRSGWAVVKVRDGAGSLARDARWRGGR